MFGGPLPTAPDRAREKRAAKRAANPSLDQRFAEFHKENPHVLTEMLKLARRELDKGVKRIGAKALWEDLRSWLKTTGQPYKLNNSYTAIYARKLVQIEPRLDGVIEFRKRKA